MLRSKVIASAAVPLACLAAASCAVPNAETGQAAGGRQQLVVSNANRSVSIQRVWTATAGERADPWDESELRRPIAPGGSSTLTFVSGSRSICFVDVRVQFSDGVTQTFGGVDVCRSGRVIAR